MIAVKSNDAAMCHWQDCEIASRLAAVNRAQTRFYAVRLNDVRRRLAAHGRPVNGNIDQVIEKTWSVP
jgi:hypothetical protein